MGIETHENRQMNPESDQFAAYLLMQTEPTRERLMGNGFDFAEFSRASGRSLVSLVTHAQALFPASFVGPAPVMGLWLYEELDPMLPSAAPSPSDLFARHRAHLMGFTAGKLGTPLYGASVAFPTRGANGADSTLVQAALATRRAAVESVDGFDLFGERNFLLVAEPIIRRGVVRQVLVTAIRNDGRALVARWLKRLEIPLESQPERDTRRAS